MGQENHRNAMIVNVDGFLKFRRSPRVAASASRFDRIAGDPSVQFIIGRFAATAALVQAHDLGERAVREQRPVARGAL
jgi:hypothetical protein